MNKRYFVIVMLLLTAASSPLLAQVDCYSRTRSQGISLMGQGHYSEAIQVLQSAQFCPDKPANDDLQAKIDECRRMMLRQEADRRARRVDMEQRMVENERKREAEFAEKGYMDVTGLRFINALSDGQDLGQSGDPLYENDIRFIKPIVSYRGLAREPRTVELALKFIGPDGRLDGSPSTPDGYSYKYTATVSPHGGVLRIDSWGSKKGGVFAPGIHTCEIWCNGRMLTSGTFTVLKNNALDNEGSFVVTGLSVANSAFDGQLLGGYGSTLYSDDIRYLKAKIRYDSDRSRSIDLSMKIHSPDGSEYTDTYSYFIQQGVNQEMTLRGLGRKNMSIFLPGSYQYDILQEGKRIFSQSFHVVESNWRVTIDKVMDQATETYSQGERYRGDLLQVGDVWKRHGMGVFCWTDGTYYWGEWSEGTYDGAGIYFAGSTYQLLHCPGCSFYVGRFANKKKTGRGSCYDMDGNLIYEGDFVDDAPTDPFPTPTPSDRRFVIQETEGGYYIGEMKEGKRDGMGILVWNTGEAWYGSWKEGSKQGEGLSLRRYSGQADDTAGPTSLEE